MGDGSGRGVAWLGLKRPVLAGCTRILQVKARTAIYAAWRGTAVPTGSITGRGEWSAETGLH